jgi:hypothetical protein
MTQSQSADTSNTIFWVDHSHPGPRPYTPHDRISDNQYLVEAILDTRKRPDGRIQYLVSWLGNYADKTSWVDKKNIEKSIVDDYEKSRVTTQTPAYDSDVDTSSEDEFVSDIDVSSDDDSDSDDDSGSEYSPENDRDHNRDMNMSSRKATKKSSSIHRARKSSVRSVGSVRPVATPARSLPCPVEDDNDLDMDSEDDVETVKPAKKPRYHKSSEDSESEVASPAGSPIRSLHDDSGESDVSEFDMDLDSDSEDDTKTVKPSNDEADSESASPGSSSALSFHDELDDSDLEMDMSSEDDTVVTPRSENIPRESSVEAVDTATAPESNAHVSQIPVARQAEEVSIANGGGPEYTQAYQVPLDEWDDLAELFPEVLTAPVDEEQLQIDFNENWNNGISLMAIPPMAIPSMAIPPMVDHQVDSEEDAEGSVISEGEQAYYAANSIFRK